MKFLKTLSIIVCALSFISCDKISETLKGTEWESSSYSTYLKTIKFTSETGFLWTSFNETNGSGVYQYENPNVYIEWREDGDYYSQTYTVASSVDIGSYKIEKITDFPEGSFSADSNGNKKNSFNAGETFKIKIPKLNV